MSTTISSRLDRLEGLGGVAPCPVCGYPDPPAWQLQQLGQEAFSDLWCAMVAELKFRWTEEPATYRRTHPPLGGGCPRCLAGSGWTDEELMSLARAADAEMGRRLALESPA